MYVVILQHAKTITLTTTFSTFFSIVLTWCNVLQNALIVGKKASWNNTWKHNSKINKSTSKINTTTFRHFWNRFLSCFQTTLIEILYEIIAVVNEFHQTLVEKITKKDYKA